MGKLLEKPKQNGNGASVTGAATAKQGAAFHLQQTHHYYWHVFMSATTWKRMREVISMA